jgi:hypothetical protein
MFDFRRTQIKLLPIDYSNHAREQMVARGATQQEVADVLRTGVSAPVRQGRLMATKVLAAGYNWRGDHYPHKEVQVIYVRGRLAIEVVTVKTRYGIWEGAA